MTSSLPGEMWARVSKQLHNIASTAWPGIGAHCCGTTCCDGWILSSSVLVPSIIGNRQK